MLPPTNYSQFGVKNITFDDAMPSYSGYDPWKYGVNSRTDDLDVTVNGEPGQNTNPPYEKLFALHYIVHRTGDGTYYDPSYGVTTTGASDYTPNADAWEALIYDPNRSPDPYQFQWRRRSSPPAVDVRFSDEDW